MSRSRRVGFGVVEQCRSVVGPAALSSAKLPQELVHSVVVVVVVTLVVSPKRLMTDAQDKCACIECVCACVRVAIPNRQRKKSSLIPRGTHFFVSTQTRRDPDLSHPLVFAKHVPPFVYVRTCRPQSYGSFFVRSPGFVQWLTNLESVFEGSAKGRVYA